MMNRRLLIAAAVAALILIGIAVVAASKGPAGTVTVQSTPSASASPTTLAGPPIDPSSPTPTPVSAGPTFSGLDFLTDKGFSEGQVNDLEFVLNNYSKAAKLNATEIDIVTSTFKDIKPSTTPTSTFDATFDGNTMKVKMEYSDLNTIHVWLSNSAGAVVYDSGTVSGQRL